MSNMYRIDKSELENSVILHMKSSLTMKPKKMVDIGPPPQPFPIYRENDTHIWVPKCFGLKHFGPPKISPQETCAAKLPRTVGVFRGTLRDYQREALDAALAGFRKYRGGIFMMDCGLGKTTSTVALIAEMSKLFKPAPADSGGFKTIILCHLDFLMNQWISEINAFLPGARVGIIKEGKCEIDNKDIVVASVHTLLSPTRTFDASMFASFGFAVVDEIHHFCAKTFSQTLPLISSMYMLGLSATPNRKDGLSGVMSAFMGPVVYAKQRPGGEANIIFTHVSLPEETVRTRKSRPWSNKYLDRSDALGAISGCSVRLQWAVQDILCHARRGRKILVLGYMRNHMLDLLRATDSSKSPEDTFSCSIYMAGKKYKRPENLLADVIFAPYAMCKDGFNIKTLDMLFLVTPMSDVEQTIGRILRTDKREEGDPIPLVIDYVDEDEPTLLGSYRARKRFYDKKKYPITHDNTKHLNKTLNQKTSLQRVIKRKVKCVFHSSDSESEGQPPKESPPTKRQRPKCVIPSSPQ
jgi:superfamily II DNA or RNA helicase